MALCRIIWGCSELQDPLRDSPEISVGSAGSAGFSGHFRDAAFFAGFLRRCRDTLRGFSATLQDSVQGGLSMRVGKSEGYWRPRIALAT